MASATKQALLAALSAAQGECISGQQLAQQLGVSRAAVHKAAAARPQHQREINAFPRWALEPPPQPAPARRLLTRRWLSAGL